MLKRVDSSSQEETITGYSYMNCKGILEKVEQLPGNHKSVRISVGAEFGGSALESVVVWKEDIPNLIKALQAYKETA